MQPISFPEQTSGFGAVGLFRFIWSHWYLIVLLLITIPSIISSINTAIETKNPSYPFLKIGLQITNADKLISQDVDSYRSNPENLVGLQKPKTGLWKRTVYYWKYFWNVIVKFLANLFLISVPFVLWYRILGLMDTSSPMKNFLWASAIAIIFIFITNLIILIHGLIAGNQMITIPQNMNNYQEMWFIIKSTLPFNGIGKLIALIAGF